MSGRSPRYVRFPLSFSRRFLLYFLLGCPVRLLSHRRFHILLRSPISLPYIFFLLLLLLFLLLLLVRLFLIWGRDPQDWLL